MTETELNLRIILNRRLNMNNCKYLIDEYPLIILPTLAKKIGLNEAIVIQRLHYWLNNDKVGKIIDGEKWVHNTYEEWQDNFPFWSIRTIQRIFLGLEKAGLVLSNKFDKSSYDQTKYYRIDYEALEKAEWGDQTQQPVIVDDDNLSHSLNDSVLTPVLNARAEIQKTEKTLDNPEEDPMDYFKKIDEERLRTNPPKPKRTLEEIKAGTASALQGHYDRMNGGGDGGIGYNIIDGDAIENFLVTVPERCREMARAFCYYMGRPPLKDEISYWRKGFDAWADIGLNKSHIIQAITRMLQEGLTIKSPNSLRTYAEKVKKEKVSSFDTANKVAVVYVSDAAKKLLQERKGD